MSDQHKARHKKPYKRLLLIFMAGLLITATACLSQKTDDGNEPAATLFAAPAVVGGGGDTVELTLSFIAANYEKKGTLIETETRVVPLDNSRSIERIALEELFHGPVTTKAMNVIPPDVELAALEREGDMVLVTLSQSEKTNNKLDLMLVRTTIALTLLNIDGIDRAGVYMDSVKRDADGTPQNLYERSAIVQSDAVDMAEERAAVLYLPDLENMGLRPLLHNINVPSGTPYEMAAATALLSELKGNMSEKDSTGGIGVNSDTTLISVLIDSRLCYINLSEPIALPDTGDDELRLIIAAFVNTVTENPEIERVSILVKGKSQERYTALSGDGYFERDSNLIIYDK